MKTNPLPFECNQVLSAPFSRRSALKTFCAGFGYLAFAGLSSEAAAPYQSPLTPKAPHFPARAKRVIFLAMQGGPSHLDTFDYKPKLQASNGKAGNRGKLVASPFKFQQYGKGGLWISELFPNLAQQADELCMINSMHTDIPNHPQAFVQLHTGSFQFVRPSMGAWTLYGLGTENQNLPGFITIAPPIALGGAQNFGSAFLPAVYQGTRVGEGAKGPQAKRRMDSGEPPGITNIRNKHLSTDEQRRQLDLVQSMNRDLLKRDEENPQVEGVIQSYELAFRMQSEVPKVMDFSKESRATVEKYGIGNGEADKFGRQCLMARRFIEAGVRYVEVCHPGWDQHQNLTTALKRNCAATDQPIAALLADLKERGLLKDTLVIWGGEFGRNPDNNQPDGRGHNAKGFTMWMAGGGVKGGLAYGSTDEVGAASVDRKVHVHDMHATTLHLLGLDHEKLTYRYAGRDFRLTDVKGHVVTDIVS
jgi:hypothetical protein